MQILNGYLLSKEPELKTKIQLDATENLTSWMDVYLSASSGFVQNGLRGQEIQ